MELIYSLDAINTAAVEFWEKAGSGNIFAFHGQMGAGKTTFIHALCEVKGVKDVISSPTFPIINEYKYDCEGTMRLLFHMDLYRLKDEEEAIRAGVEDCLFSGFICLVEWPEKAPSIFPDTAVHVYLELVDEKTRSIKIAEN
ncbi:MAG: tRNA (adenosine(37)-N6)-threonylcarbamoyltransferase complex ATPase subunit type 1 TsaE [Chitinophagaceae bacterium]|nr:tRNA (adenosine(37)-N6)-threonylcarbamoyltransferase complex ATPase subunit type 1 TsaE [Chitinophagaceae bacterium]MBK8607673.1 tRNA (adenosine(37)-N6)-threonylcarbamoyltransferase complex ATPase subunit type 1 TsaE [Chitinophagaceae bacterium]MBP6478917.1 tRNA (adenosine(37)-N6)-threonylcarbamoyltransferase complex ATPase subunit type 1 TsaE [Chitinophagaceae bacterium]MBP7107172.1 tRNA (adenosine(37)-N6)-threonylcarbamoyltransferase complex ATPase subunit type 1 TsaE [Chitinophagaceae bact